MEFAVERKVLNGLPAISLEGSAEIVDRDSGELGHHPIGDAAWQTACQPSVPPLGSPPADDIESFLDFRDEARDLFRVVLQVAIHGDDDVAARNIKTCLECRGLAEIPAKSDNSYPRIALIDSLKSRRGLVRTTVVDEDNLIRFV